MPAMLRRTALFALLLALALPAAARADTTRVYLLHGEQMGAVTRTLPVGAGRLRAGLGALFAGPTAAERRAAYGTAIPRGVALTAAAVHGPRVTLRLSRRFGTDDPALATARLSQVVFTAYAATGFTRFRVRVPGRPDTVTSTADYAPPAFALPKPPAERIIPPSDPRTVQTRLAALSYLPPDAATGSYDYRTQQAVLAFQSWEGLARDGVVGPMTLARLMTATTPIPLSAARGRHIEIYRSKGVVLLLDGAKVVRAIHTSTGVGGDAPDLGTPPGRFAIYRKEIRSWSVPYKSWLPYASYWNAGWALHGYASVPAQPASHGCARLPLPEARIVYAFARIGTPVRVI
jgi:lipoprotein-anchoring transpeptidase ErfK/SrfK